MIWAESACIVLRLAIGIMETDWLAEGQVLGMDYVFTLLLEGLTYYTR